MESDAQIVKTVLNGEKEAFAVLVKRYERPVRLVALNVLHEYHLACDASQDAFVKAYQSLTALRNPDAFGPWLMKITHRCAIDSMRQKPKNAPLELEIAASSQLVEKSNGRLDDDKLRVLSAVMKLPKPQRQVIMLRYFSGHAVKDVSEIVNRSVGTVTKQLSRAHHRLRKILKEI